MKKNLLIILIGLGAGSLYGTKSVFVGPNGLPVPNMNQNHQPNPDAFDLAEIEKETRHIQLRILSDTLREQRRIKKSQAPKGLGIAQPRKLNFE